MKIGRYVIPWVLLGSFVMPGWAGDRDQLQQTFEAALERIREKDTQGLVAYFHPEAVLFFRDRLFPLDFEQVGTQGFNDILERFFFEVTAAEVRPMDVSYRVVNDVGLVWGLSQFNVDPKSGGGSNLQSRISVVFTKVNGAWKILHWHASAIPSGRTQVVSP